MTATSTALGTTPAVSDQLRDPDRAVSGLPQSPSRGRPLHQRGDRGARPGPPRVGHVHLPPSLRPPARPPRRRRRSRPPTPHYLRDHRDGRYANDARQYLAWWDKVTVPGEYRVTLRRGTVESDVGKTLGGGPDLGVIVEVAGITYGPSPVVRNTHQPIWDYTFARPIRWKLGDPVSVRIIDYDWSDSTIFTLNSRKGDPLAIRNLSGTLKPAKGVRRASSSPRNFQMPLLSKPD